MSIKERFNYFLKITNKNPNSLAKEINVNQKTLDNISSGKSKPSSLVLVPLSNMGLNINWLLTGEGEMFTKKTLSKEEQKIINQGTISSIGDHNSIENKSINETLYLKEIEHLNEIITQLKAQLKDKQAIIELLSQK